jgi:hypothetical protein
MVIVKCPGYFGRRRIMAQKKKLLAPTFQVWVDARKQFRLSHAHTQMARELGLNPKKLGKLANHDQEKWKAPLPIFIEDLYFKQFERFRPEHVMTIEEILRRKKSMKEQARARKLGIEDSRDEDQSGDPF